MAKTSKELSIEARLESQLRAKSTQHKEVDKKYRALQDDLAKAHKALENALGLKAYKPKPFKIQCHPNDTKGEATAVVLLSDWHADEIVVPSKVSYLNKFNPDIAEKRAARCFDLIVRFLRMERRDSTIDNLVLWLGGDFITSSEMHDAHCAFEPAVAITFVQDLLISGIKFLVEQEPDLRIQIVGSVGNHSRMSGSAQKVNQSTEQERSLEWFMYHNLRSMFSAEKNINFLLENGYQTYLELYGRKHRFNHGHLHWRYNDGMGGVHGPLWKVISQKWDNQVKAATTSCGHYHTYTPAGRGRPYVVNGSLIGPSPYGMGFGSAEEPIQAFHLIHSKYGLVGQHPLFVGV